MSLKLRGERAFAAIWLSEDERRDVALKATDHGRQAAVAIAAGDGDGIAPTLARLAAGFAFLLRPDLEDFTLARACPVTTG